MMKPKFISNALFLLFFILPNVRKFSKNLDKFTQNLHEGPEGLQREIYVNFATFRRAKKKRDTGAKVAARGFFFVKRNVAKFI